ncbi:unnamed protein product [Ophioblennius macclurei]
MARLDNVIETLMSVFQETALKGGKKRRLSKDDLKAILEKDLTSSDLREAITAEDIQEAINTMDKNNDGELTFHEFCRCVSYLAKIYYGKKTGRGEKRGKNKEAEPETTDS